VVKKLFFIVGGWLSWTHLSFVLVDVLHQIHQNEGWIPVVRKFTKMRVGYLWWEKSIKVTRWFC